MCNITVYTSNSFLAVGDFCHLLIAFANRNFGPDQTLLDLDRNCLKANIACPGKHIFAP